MCHKQQKNVFYITEHLIHAVKILTEVSIILDTEEVVFFFFKLHDHIKNDVFNISEKYLYTS